MPVRIEPMTEAEATMLYQSLWNNREKGEQLHAKLEDLVDMCDTTAADQNLAMGIKYRISRILLHLTTSEVTPIRMHLIRLFFNLDTKISMILLESFRDQDWNMIDAPLPG